MNGVAATPRKPSEEWTRNSTGRTKLNASIQPEMFNVVCDDVTVENKAALPGCEVFQVILEIGQRCLVVKIFIIFKISLFFDSELYPTAIDCETILNNLENNRTS